MLCNRSFMILCCNSNFSGIEDHKYLSQSLKVIKFLIYSKKKFREFSLITIFTTSWSLTRGIVQRAIKPSNLRPAMTRWRKKLFQTMWKMHFNLPSMSFVNRVKCSMCNLFMIAEMRENWTINNLFIATNTSQMTRNLIVHVPPLNPISYQHSFKMELSDSLSVAKRWIVRMFGWGSRKGLENRLTCSCNSGFAVP